MRTSDIEVSTREYEWSTGKAPRGTGNWAFNIGGEVEFIYGSYTEAKKLAQIAAKKLGLWSIKVLP